MCPGARTKASGAECRPQELHASRSSNAVSKTQPSVSIGAVSACAGGLYLFVLNVLHQLVVLRHGRYTPADGRTQVCPNVNRSVVLVNRGPVDRLPCSGFSLTFRDNSA
jgi:hypothetical protein